MAEFGSTQLDIIQDAVDTISNTGIVGLTTAVSGLGWWSKYSREQVRGAYTNAALGGADVYGTVLNITGKGYLSKALFNYQIASDARMRITVDGTVVIHTRRKNGSDSPVCGFICSRLIIGTNTSTPMAMFLGSVKSLSYYEKLLGDVTLTEADAIYTSIEPLMFNTSLKVELVNVAGSGTNINLDMEYGVMN